MTGREIRRFVGRKVWDTYHKICFERNPWDRFISAYHWDRLVRWGDDSYTFAAAFESGLPQTMRQKGLEVYTIDGKVAVDRVCLYENLTEELERFRMRVGIPEPLVLPRAKANIRADRRPYHEVLGPNERERIAQLFAQEIDLFGFKF